MLTRRVLAPGRILPRLLRLAVQRMLGGVLLLVVVVGQVETLAEAGSIKTDRGVYPPLPVKLPEPGETFVDPTFGTRILRVTGPQDGPRNQHAYSYWPSFNQDNTHFLIDRSGRPTLYRFDPGELKILGSRPVFSGRTPDGSTPGWEDVIFSGRDPDLLFCHSGLKLWCYRIRTGEYKLVKDFSKELPPGHLHQMSKSLDDHTFGFSRQDPRYKVVGYLVWKRDADQIVLRQDTENLDEIQVDKSGRFCVIKTGRQGKGVVEVRLADLGTGKIEDLVDNGPDYAPGHSDNGHGTVVGADNWQNRVTFRQLATPHQLRTVFDLKNDWSQDYHISMLADNEDWVLLSFYVGNNLPSSGVFRGEIVQVATDGSARVRRLAHHRSIVREYWDSPRATISRDGRFVLFTSNWEGTGQRDVLILEVPPLEAPIRTTFLPGSHSAQHPGPPQGECGARNEEMKTW
jgi:hypothetical protein